MKTKCHKCKYEWDYKGESDFFITCPRCLTKVKSLNWNREKKGEKD